MLYIDIYILEKYAASTLRLENLCCSLLCFVTDPGLDFFGVLTNRRSGGCEALRLTAGFSVFIFRLSVQLHLVKCTLVQALRLCTGRTAHRGSRSIDLLFHDHGTRRG